MGPALKLLLLSVALLCVVYVSTQPAQEKPSTSSEMHGETVSITLPYAEFDIM